MKKKISVIIPTVNAYEELDLCLTSIEKNSDNQIELCVIIDPDQKTGDINKDILKVCSDHKLKAWINKENLGPYGNWNRGAEVANTDWFVFATDDQYFAPHWDSNLLKYWKPKRLVAGRLVEPGVISVYKTNIKKDFGVLPKEFKESEFINWCVNQANTGFAPDGFFIPLLQSREDFEALGRYKSDGKFGTSSAVSNDYAYITHAKELGYEFGTAEDSYSYHFQASSWKKKTLHPSITAIVLTKNEEIDLENCLNSLSWVDQILVVDSGSTDKTLSIAKKYKANIIKHNFDNFASSRNFALSKADSDWVLMIDADEVCEDELATELLSFAKDIYLDGVYIPRKNYIFGKWIEHTDWYPDYRLVFVRPKNANYVGDVHEHVEFKTGRISTANATFHLIHHNYDRVSEFVTKNLVEYPLAYAKVLDNEKVEFNTVDLFSKPISEFLRRFFMREGYKDGMYGLLLSALMGVQSFVAYCYLWELQGKKKDLTSKDTKALFASLYSKGAELTYWLTTMAVDGSNGIAKLYHKARRKTLKMIKGL